VPPVLTPGDIVERYRIELLLGRGGMALVYRVRHLSLETVHALKVLQVDDPMVRERLVREGRVQARIRHPNVVSVRDVLEVEGAPALLMDFVGGGSLADRLERGPLPPEEALSLFRGVVAGVAHAHAHGLVHRDLKPANVLLDRDEAGALLPRVTDFGLARLSDDTLDRQHRTRQGQAMGTPAYMAPEQIRDASAVDQRADIWSLGVILYELLCGQRPFEAPDVVSLMYQVASGRYEAPRRVRPELEAPLAMAIEGALCLDREARIPDCEALLAVLDGDRSWAPPPPAAEAASQTWDPALSALPRAAPAPLPGPAPLPPLPPPLEGGGVAALVVDEAGRGHVVELVLSLVPGGAGVWAPDGVSREARVAAQVAVAVALGPEAARHGVRWGLRGHRAELTGTSIGLAIGLATLAALRGQRLPSGWAITGGLDLDGRVASVGGLPAKLRASAAAGLVQVAAPAEDVQRVEPIDGVRLHGFARFEQAAAALLPLPAPAPPRRRHLRLLALLAVPLLAFSGALALPEALVQHRLLDLVRGPLAFENTLILGIDTPEPRGLRPQHAGTLRALADAGARAVLIDLSFSASEPAVDEEIARAVEELEARGVPVIQGVRFGLTDPALPGTPALAAAARAGSVEAAAVGPLDTVVGVRIRRRASDGSAYWHTAALAAGASLGGAEPSLEGNRLRLGPLSSAVTGELLALPPLAAEVPRLAYGDRASFGRARGKVVVLGAFGGGRDQDVHRLPDGPRYGTEVQAAAVETLLQGAAPRRLSPELDAGLALLGGVGVVGLGRLLPRRLRLLSLGLPATLLAIGLALLFAGLLVGLVGLLAAAAVGLWVEGASRRAG
jgi:eukaryotic-like serine/threonine-protein kinase